MSLARDPQNKTKPAKKKRQLGGDAASGGSKQMEKAARFKKKPAYRRAVRESYDSTRPAQRTRRLGVATERAKAGALQPEDRIISDTHQHRIAAAHRLLERGRIGAGKDIKSDKEFAVAKAFKLFTDANRAEANRDVKHDSDFRLGDDQRKRTRWGLESKARRIEPLHAKPLDPLKHHDSDIYETDPARLAALGFKKEGTAGKIIGSPKYALGALASGTALLEATYHDPVGVPTKTAKQALDAVPALFGEAYDLVTHPVKTVKAQAKEFAARSSQSYAERVKTIRKEGGLAYGSDAALVAAPASLSARFGLRLTRKGSGAARARVRVSGAAPAPRRDAGVLRDAVGGTKDKLRARKHERQLVAAEAGGAPVDALVREAAEANRRAGRVVEVVGHFAGKRQVKGVAKLKGHGHYGFKRDQGQRLGAAKKLINKLDKHEKRAFYYAALGIRTPQQAMELLPNLRKKIVDTRKAEGITVKGSLKKSDMLPDIDAILADPIAHFTPKLAEIMDAIAPDARRAGHEDPSFDDGIDRGRRHAPLADLFGMERGDLGDVPDVVVTPNLAEPRVRREKVGEKVYEFNDGPPFEHDYQPSAEGINAKTWYHGTNTKDLKVEDLDGTLSDVQSLFGQGVYLTDRRGIAESYAKNRSRNRGEPTTYEAKLNVKNPVDMDATLDPVFSGALYKAARAIGHLGGNHHDPDPFILDQLVKAIEEKGGIDKLSNADLYTEFMDAVAEFAGDYGLSKGDLTEYFQDIASDLRERGFDSLTHVGGVRVGDGKKLHQVTILLDPANTGSLRNVEHQATRFAAAEPTPKGTLRVGRYDFREEVPPAPHVVPGMRYFDEPDADFTDRLAQTAESKGMAEPLYFKSERYVGPRDYAARALGGVRAAATDQHYKGVNLRQGLQDTSPDQFLRGNARSIKRKHNWELVASIADKNKIESLSRDGSSVSAIRERAAKDGVDPGSYALWNPGVMRRFAEQHVGDATDERFIQPEEFDIASVDAGLKHSTIRVNEHGQAVDGTGKLVDEGELAKTSGWVAVPDQVLKELEAQMVPSGKYARGWDVAKGKASRAMLLTGNLPWLGFQVASNTAMGAAATGGRLLNPANWVHAWKDWHNLSHEEQQRLGSILGLDATSADTNQRKLGATTNNDFVNAYRAMKSHPMWHTGVAGGRGPSISELNPLELMARADRGQNNIFRTVAGYSLAKRDAVRRMGESMGTADKLQLKLISIFKKPPDEMLRALRDDPDLLERHGDAVADWMGDYASMTSNERKVLGRTVMFYPYIRYSLKLLFWTLPVKHPAVTAVLAELGNMKAEELKKLLGEDSLPFNIGKIYFTKDGQVTSIDLRRANPALNSVIDAARNRSLSQAVGIAPPFVGWLYNQVAQENNFTGKDWMVQGRTRQFGGPKLSPADPLRARILADDVLSIAFPYRLAQHMEFNPAKLGEDDRLKGAQGDDSLIFSPRPTHFGGKHPDTLAKLQAKFSGRRERFEEDHESLIHELIPLLPSPDRGAAETREAAIVKKAEQPKKKHKAAGYGFKGDRVKTPHFGKSKSKSGYNFK